MDKNPDDQSNLRDEISEIRSLIIQDRIGTAEVRNGRVSNLLSLFGIMLLLVGFTTGGQYFLAKQAIRSEVETLERSVAAFNAAFDVTREAMTATEENVNRILEVTLNSMEREVSLLREETRRQANENERRIIDASRSQEDFENEIRRIIQNSSETPRMEINASSDSWRVRGPFVESDNTSEFCLIELPLEITNIGKSLVTLERYEIFVDSPLSYGRLESKEGFFDSAVRENENMIFFPNVAESSFTFSQAIDPESAKIFLSRHSNSRKYKVKLRLYFLGFGNTGAVENYEGSFGFTEESFDCFRKISN